MQNTELLTRLLQLNPRIRRVPVEIWTEIFSHYCDLDVDLNVDPTQLSVEFWDGSYRHLLQTVTRTCRRWRDLVYSNPKFWSSYYIDLDSVSTFKEADSLARIFSRSGAKLRLDIIYTTEETDFSPTSMATGRFRVITALLEMANRWRDVRLDLSMENFSRLVETLGANGKPGHGYFPNLERLDCSESLEHSVMTNDAHDPDHLALYHIFDPCPALTHLRTSTGFWDTRSPFNYANLTSLEILRFEGSSLAPLLFQCACLQRFSIAQSRIFEVGEFGYRDHGPWSSENVLIHRSITTLCLPTYDRDRFSAALWVDLRFSSLKTLHFKGAQPLGIENELLDVLAISGRDCKLQTLVLGDVSSKVFRKLLYVTSAVKSLTLEDSYFIAGLKRDPTFINQLFAPLYGSESCVPIRHLSYLKLEIRPWIFRKLGILTQKNWGRKRPLTLSDFTFEEADEAYLVGNAYDSDDSSGTATESESEFETDSGADSDSDREEGREERKYAAAPNGEVSQGNSIGSEADSGSVECDSQTSPKADPVSYRTNRVQTLVNRLGLMIKSRRSEAPPSVHIRMTPVDSFPLLTRVNADSMLTELPKCLLAANSLVTVELYWDTTAE
ncbi:hypothetical protein F5880DRAFT_1221500 [Lentinula raphanica]|nr:hypothetical protein F5880DRAFT_1221500 [Lentinula raphanica]